MIIKDQLNRTLSFKSIPKRIVSLVPSQTELLVDLGLINDIVGITKFCIHPDNLRKSKTIVGGTKQVNIEKIRALQPDVILCNKEENTQEMVNQLEEIAPVHVSDISNLKDTRELINLYGQLFNVNNMANSIVKKLQHLESEFLLFIKNKSIKNVAYFIWRKPWMVAGGDTIINFLLSINKFHNIFEDIVRYPEIKLELLKDKDLDYIFLSSEPYPFKEKHFNEIKNVLPKSQIFLVDGEYFSWYGTRLLGAFNYFKNLHKIIHDKY
ncbi:helical backbone metal receptor [Flavobacteriaceae bacterium]|nr:helical backbone metal receptor [Flavobacteriaceae bacterium]